MINPIILQASTQNVDVTTIEKLLNKLFDKSILLGEKLLIAILAVIIGIWVIRILSNIIKKLLIRKKVEATVASFINSLTITSLRILLFIIIIGILGVETTSFAAMLAAGGLAIGMAMKDNLSNFAGGVMILLNTPFKIGDYIVAQGQEGTVKEIGILYTILITMDGRTVFLPNGPLSTGSIVNNSTQTTRRIDISFNINNGNNIDEIKKEIGSIINENKLILQTQPPYVGVTAINNGNFDITLRVWTDSSNYGSLRTELNETIYCKLSEKNILVAPYVTIKN